MVWRKGTSIVFPDWSAEQQDVLGHVGGWGICYLLNDKSVRLEIQGPLPHSEGHQTNNAVELYVGEQALLAPRSVVGPSPSPLTQNYWLKGCKMQLTGGGQMGGGGGRVESRMWDCAVGC